MPLACKIENDVECLNCGEDEEIFMHEKEEANLIKLQYTCEECQQEWTERVARGSDRRQ